MVTVPRPPPRAEIVREREGKSHIGQFLKGLHDAEPPEEGVTRFTVRPKKPSKNYRWCKNVGRYRYKAKEVDETGKKIGGRFMKTPPNAPPIWKRQ